VSALAGMYRSDWSVSEVRCMATYQLKGLDLFDAIGKFVCSRGGQVLNSRGETELRFELPAAKADDIRADLELLGYAPQCLSHDLRLHASEIIKVSVYCLPLG
jgi:hypothetical protein